MSFTASLSRITDCYNMVFLFETVCLLATVHSTWIPHFPQNSEEFFFHAENLPVFPESVFLRVFSFIPPRITYRLSEDKLRKLGRFSSAELGGSKIVVIDDCSNKLHLAWQFLCSSIKNIVIDIYMYTYVLVIFILSLLGSHEIRVVARYIVKMLSMALINKLASNARMASKDIIVHSCS